MPGTTNRDLASAELWQGSLERSRRRRVLAAAARKDHTRRKTASFAVSAGVAAAPVWPSVTASADDLSKNDVEALARTLRPDDGERVLLAFGDTGSAVAEVQRALAIPDDGIFGPQTEAALRAFQEQNGLSATGKIDVRTWLELFPTDMIVYAPAGSASALGASRADGPQWAAVSGPPTGSEAGGGSTTAQASQDGTTETPQAREAAVQTPALGADSEAPDGTASEPDALGPPAGAPGDVPAPGGPSPSPGGGDGPSPTFPFRPGGTVGEMIAAMIGAANRIDAHHYAYRWGGGHNAGFSGPYDCSGAVSAVLHAAGLLRSPLVSGNFAHWGAPGRGAVTIYANAGHVYMSIQGRFFGTSRSNPGGGAGWFRGAPRPGFAVVHVPFSRLHLRRDRRHKKPSRRHVGGRGQPAPLAPPAAPPTGTGTTGAPVATPSPPPSPPASTPSYPQPQIETPATSVTSPGTVTMPSTPPAVVAPTAGTESPGSSPGTGETQAGGAPTGSGSPGFTPAAPVQEPVSAPVDSSEQGTGTPSGSSGAGDVAVGDGSSGSTQQPAAASPPSGPQSAPPADEVDGAAVGSEDSDEGSSGDPATGQSGSPAEGPATGSSSTD